MARKDKKDNENNEVTIVGAMDDTPEVKNNQVLPPRNKPTLTFDSWWVQVQRREGLKNSMKEAVYKHFRATGVLTTRDFEQGLVHFGLK